MIGSTLLFVSHNKEAKSLPPDAFLTRKSKKMHFDREVGALPQTPLGRLQHSTTPPSRIKGPTSNGKEPTFKEMGGKWNKEGKGRKDGKNPPKYALLRL